MANEMTAKAVGKNETKLSDLIIVSAYGRGHWLAAECARRNWQVTLLEVTPKEVPGYPPEDWEGPWGFFETKDLLPSQREILLDSAQVYPVRGGFTFWLQEGPLEMNGPLADFHSQSFAIPEAVTEYLSGVENASDDQIGDEVVAPPKKDQPIWLSHLTLRGLEAPRPLKGLSGLRRKINDLAFEKSWLAHLAHTLASPVQVENKEAMDFGTPLALRAPYGVRHLSWNEITADLKKLEGLGVRVRQLSDIYDVRVQSGHFESIVVDEAGDIEKARAFVWMLSSGETQKFPERIMHSLYPSGPLKPSYFWARFRFRLKGVTSAHSLPLAAAIVESRFLPWTHSNLLLMKRIRENTNETVPLDIWMKVPIRVLGDQTYFEGLRDECLKVLSVRVPLSEPVCESLPLEAKSGSVTPESLRFPIFEKNAFESLDVTRAKNLFFSSVEQWKGFDWNSQMRFSTAIFAALERLRAHWENVSRRLAAKDHGTHLRGDMQP